MLIDDLGREFHSTIYLVLRSSGMLIDVLEIEFNSTLH